ncbi:MAG: NADH-quinone oxidoreductase subunit N [Chloroflexota bacterium]
MIETPVLNFKVIGPPLALVIAAAVVLLLDLFLPRQRKQALAYIALAGIVAAFVATGLLWDATDPAFAGLDGMAVADGYALFFNLVFLTVAGLAVLISVDYAAREGLAQGEYYALLLLSTAGMSVMAAAADLMVLFVGLEVLSIPLYVLAALKRGRAESNESGLKYFLLGAFASAFLLYGIALTYGASGGTALSAVAAGLAADSASRLLAVAGLGLMLVGLGFKVALAPFHTWTPDVYQGAPTSVTAFMSVGAKAAGFAALGRALAVAFPALLADWSPLLAVLAALTMTLGNVGALRQTDLKRLLAYSSVAHAGYLLVGLAAGSEAGLGGVLFYLLAYGFMNVGAFAALMAAQRSDGSAVTVANIAGLGARKPALAAGLTLALLSLAGLPPLAGFMAKFTLFRAAVQADLAWLAVLGVLNSVVSAYFYLKVIVAMWLREPAEAELVETCSLVGAVVAASAAGMLLLGVLPSLLLALAEASARGVWGF